jgi:hypothetical protein
MGSRGEWFCWEIMQCEDSEDCPAKKNLDKPCWEIVAELGDYRAACDICRDCIVHVLKAGTSALSSEEIRSIVEIKTSCMLVHTHSCHLSKNRNVFSSPPG